MAAETLRFRDFFWKGRGQVKEIPFHEGRHHEDDIKTIHVDNVWKEGSVSFRSGFALAHSCPLFRKFGAKHFLQLNFHKDCPKFIVEPMISKGLRIKMDASKESSTYLFFGHSSTQLKNRTCIMYDSRLGSPDEIIGLFGTFTSNNAGKRAARIGLLLSEAEVTVDLNEGQILRIDDIKKKTRYSEQKEVEYNFTDGCGFIHKDLAKKVYECLKENKKVYRSLKEKGCIAVSSDCSISEEDLPVPSVFQIRIKGCKGVLMLTDETKWKDCIVIRPSMEKFSWKLPPPYSLGICDGGKAFSLPKTYGLLNIQFIRLFSALGVPDGVFLKIQEEFYKDLGAISTDPNVQVKFLCAYGYSYEAESILYKNSINDVAQERLKMIKKKYITLPHSQKSKWFDPGPLREWKKNFGRLKIPVEKSRCVFGVADPSGTLEYGTCFFQPTYHNEKPRAFQRITVIVAKSPAYHPGDVRILRCVDVPACHHLVDCVVFPVQGRRPHPDELSGGDLDGDLYFVCWDEDLVANLKPVEAYEYAVKAASYEGETVDPVAQVGHSDLVKHFIEYNGRQLGDLDKLFSAWANVQGADCRQCLRIAEAFNTAVDTPKTGKVVDVSLAFPPMNLKKRTFVWEAMLNKADSFYQNECGLYPRRNLSLLDEDDILSIIKSEDNRIPEYNLFRLIYKWREHRDMSAEVRGTLFEDLMKEIDFSCLTANQRKLALTDLAPLGPAFGQLVMNALYRSTILKDFDIDRLQRGFSLKEYNWVHYYCSIDGSQISWITINNAMQTPNLKLVVLKFDDSEGHEMIVGLGISGKLALHGSVCVKSGGVKSAVYISNHYEPNENASSAFVSLSEDYEIALDGEALQLYDCRGSNRDNTFVCLKQYDDSMRLSVALNKFDDKRQVFFSTHRGRKVKKVQLSQVEIFINTPKPMIAPAVKISSTQDILYTRSPLHLYPSMPTTASYTEELEERYSKLEEKTRIGETVIGDIRGRLQLMVSDPESHQEEAKYLEALLSKSSDDAKHLEANECRQLLELLLQTSAPVSFLKRFVDTMRSAALYFSGDQCIRIVSHLIFCCEDRKLAVEFLSLVQDSENFPLSSSDFYSLEAMQYFLHWFPAATIELLHGVMDVERTSSDYAHLGFTLTRAFRFGGQTVSKIKLTTRGPHQPFSREDGLMFCLDCCNGQRFFFAEIVDMDGMTLTIHIVWPEQHEAVTELQELLDTFTDENGPKFKVRPFPNLVTYRIQLEALKSSCIKGHLEPRPSRIVREIVKSFKQYLIEDKDLQIRESTEQLFEVLRSSNLSGSQGENHTGSEASVERSDIETDAAPQDLETDEPKEIPNVSILRSTRPSKKRVAFDLDQITFNIPGRTQLPPRLEKRELHKRSHSSGRTQRVNLSDPVDESQRSAILDAVDKNLTIIRGPPGTGKTHVAAIIVREWFRMESHAKIMVTAASNQAVVNLYRMLLAVGVLPEVIQFLGQLDNLPLDIQTSSMRTEYMSMASRAQRQDCNSRLGERIIQKPRIVCCTLTSSGAALLKNSHFKYAIVDEASHAQEVLTLVPLCTGVETVCLVGDDRQHNPTVSSKDTLKSKTSLFERLRLSGVPVHLLNIQHRMHPFIASFPSQHFYEGRLKNGICARDRLLGRNSVFPKAEKPVVFYNIENGFEELKGNSMLNNKEAERVANIVSELMKIGSIRLEDIGIITPYKGQVDRIKALLNEKFPRIPNDLVHTVDHFQGQERKVVIVSTVRANKEKGQKPTGPLREPHLINVLLTRARCGLVVIGNGDTLAREPLWQKWLQFVRENEVIVNLGESQNRNPGEERAETNRGRGGRGWNRGRGSNHDHRMNAGFFDQRRGSNRGRDNSRWNEGNSRGRSQRRGHF